MSLDLIARQLKRETEAAELARKRMHDARREANERSYASSNIESRKAIVQFTDPIATTITRRYGKLSQGRAGLDAASVVNHLKGADPHTLALITMKVCLDCLGKNPEPQIQQLTTAIGKAVQLELRLCYYAEEYPDLYKQAGRFFHPSTGTRQKATVIKLTFNREGIEWEPWTNGVNHKVGQWLLQAMNDTTGWLQRANDRPGGGKKTITRICYSREFIAHRDTILAAAEELAFCQWPMLCPPIEWTNDRNGGYLTEQIRRVNPLIRKAGKVASLRQGDIPLAMLNNLQGQAFKINAAILAIAETCYANKETVGKFVCHAPMPIPQSPGDDCTEEQLSAYKRARREAEDFNAQISQKNWRTTEAMFVARKYANEPRWWCAASMDYRGRLYFLNTALNPQGTDFDKALICSADEGPVDEYWLSFHVATTWGLSKDTMADRVKWSRENHCLIDRIASDPIRNKEWQDADEPWCFLAAAIEYKACVIDSTRHLSGLFCGIDATCSGLQHLSALTRCGDTAALVNVTPTDKPADAYLTVAEAAKKYLPKEQQKWLNRRTTKRSVMTTPYGVTMSSARGYIRDQLIKDGYKEQLREPGVLNGIVKAIFNHAIPEVIPGPVQVMAWLKRSAGEIIDRGDTTITWTSPSGFVVNQHLNKSNTVRIDTRIMGGARINCQVADGFSDEPDRLHHKSALAPNVTHSMDAALIHLTFAFWDKPFTVIHDCVLGRSCDMSQMAHDIRLHFAEMYKADVLADWADQVGVELPNDLIKNTLDIESVNESLYFFS